MTVVGFASSFLLKYQANNAVKLQTTRSYLHMSCSKASNAASLHEQMNSDAGSSVEYELRLFHWKPLTASENGRLLNILASYFSLRQKYDDHRCSQAQTSSQTQRKFIGFRRNQDGISRNPEAGKQADCDFVGQRPAASTKATCRRTSGKCSSGRQQCDQREQEGADQQGHRVSNTAHAYPGKGSCTDQTDATEVYDNSGGLRKDKHVDSEADAERSNGGSVLPTCLQLAIFNPSGLEGNRESLPGGEANPGGGTGSAETVATQSSCTGAQGKRLKAAIHKESGSSCSGGLNSNEIMKPFSDPLETAKQLAVKASIAGLDPIVPNEHYIGRSAKVDAGSEVGYTHTTNQILAAVHTQHACEGKHSVPVATEFSTPSLFAPIADTFVACLVNSLKRVNFLHELVSTSFVMNSMSEVVNTIIGGGERGRRWGEEGLDEQARQRDPFRTLCYSNDLEPDNVYTLISPSDPHSTPLSPGAGASFNTTLTYEALFPPDMRYMDIKHNDGLHTGFVGCTVLRMPRSHCGLRDHGVTDVVCKLP